MLGGLQLLLVAQESQFRHSDPWSRILRPGNALEHFHKRCSALGVKKEALAVADGDGLEGRFGSQEQIGFRSRSMTAEDLLDLAPHRFDGIEVWRIRDRKSVV